ncbi:MAG: hypothetical protein HGB11_10330 [Chlorobiales bacterium]|nr:hypothetical protein [Chlorobiales bacterium]
MRFERTRKSHGDKGNSNNDDIANGGNGDEVLGELGGEEEGESLSDCGGDEKLLRAKQAGFVTKPAQAHVPKNEV